MHKHQHANSCKDLLGSLSEYVEGSLGEELCRTIEEHMAECENCRIVVDTLSKTVYLYRATSDDVEVPGEVRDRLFEKLQLDDLLKPGKSAV